MTKKNPDDSVRDEQFEATEIAGETEDATPAEKAEKTDDQAVIDEKKQDPELIVKETVNLNEEVEEDSDENELHEDDAVPSLDEIELPPVDYSGYTKNELVETLGMIIDNRPPAEIRNDVDRLKILFYKKLKLESEERKSKFLEEGGKIEDYKPWIDPQEVLVKHFLEKYREKKTDFNKIQEAEKYENLKKNFNEAGYLEIAIFKSNPSKFGSANSLLGLNYRDVINIVFS